MFYPKTSYIYYIALPLPVGEEEIAEVGEMIGAAISGISKKDLIYIKHAICCYISCLLQHVVVDHPRN